MLKISREVDLGLLWLTELARHSSGKLREVMGLKEWAEKRDLPYRYLSKIAVRLKKAGLVKSKEGREGGYWLARKAKKIKVGEVIKVLEGPIAAVKCVDGEKCKCAGFCGHKSLMGKLSKAVERQLNRVTIEDLC